MNTSRTTVIEVSIENISRTSIDVAERVIAFVAAAKRNPFGNIEDAHDAIRAAFPELYRHRGGSHLAVIDSKTSDDRLIFIVERVVETAAAEPSDGYCINLYGTECNALRETNDCTVRAFTNVSGKSYTETHAILAKHGRKPRKGFRTALHVHDVSRDLGVKVREVRRSGTVLRLVRDFPKGKFLVTIRGHAFAVIDGVIHDAYRPSKLCRVKHAWLVEAA